MVAVVHQHESQDSNYAPLSHQSGRIYRRWALAWEGALISSGRGAAGTNHNQIVTNEGFSSAVRWSPPQILQSSSNPAAAHNESINPALAGGE